MRKIIVAAAGMLLAAAATGAFAADAPSKEDEERCERYAIEDEIPAEDRQAYIQQCLADLMEDPEAQEDGHSDEMQQPPSSDPSY
jgi:hypothetical protein